MRPRGPTFLAARREVRDRLRSRAFHASAVVQLLIVVGIVIAATLTGGDGPDRVKLATVGAQARATGAAARARERSYNLRAALRPQRRRAHLRARPSCASERRSS